jgi:hypothetical protein
VSEEQGMSIVEALREIREILSAILVEMKKGRP